MEDVIINKEVEVYKSIALSEKRPKIEKLMEKLGYKPHKGQRVILDIIDKTPELFYFYVLVISRRWGKTFFVSLIATCELLIPFASVIIIAGQSKQSALIYKEIVKNLKTLGVGFAKIDNNTMEFSLENGSECIVGTEKNLEASEGRKASLIIVEEAGLVNSIDNIINSLSPSLATYGTRDNGFPVGKIIINGTYKGSKEHKKYFIKGQTEQDKGYISFSRPSSDNPLNTKEFLEGQRELLSESIYQREYEGKLIDVAGTDVFYGFDYKKNIISYDTLLSTIDKNSYIITSLDVGATDNSAYVLIKVEAGKYYVVDGFAENNLNEELLAKKIKELEAKYKITPEVRYIDPSAKITRIGLSGTYNLDFFPAMNAVSSGISVLNQLFIKGRLFISDKFNELITEIQTIEYKENAPKNGDIFKRVKGHHFDLIHALRYAVFTHYRIYGGDYED